MALTAHSERKRAQPVAAVIVIFLALFAAASVVLTLGDSLPLNLTRAAALVFMVAMVPFLVLAHEGGHYAVARLLGWRVALFTWGGYTVRLTPWRIKHGAPPFSDASGAVVAVPPRVPQSRWGYIAVFAGGPGANLLMAGLAARVATAIPGETAVFFWLLAIISLLMGLNNLRPGLRGSDGSQIASLYFARDMTLRTVMAQLAEQMIQDVRPRDWPPELMQVLIRLTLWTPIPDLLQLVYVWRMDRGEDRSALEVLERAGEDPELLIERAFFAAYVEADGAAAHAHLARVEPMPSRLCYWRARAALAVLEHEVSLACEAIRMGRILADDQAYATVWDREILDQLELRAKA